MEEVCWKTQESNERIILELILKKEDWGVEWIHLAQDRAQFGAVVYTVMSPRVR
jgi:hypothetical protein